jgi:hypothetical protein
MRSLFLPFVALCPAVASATPFVLDLQATGEPTHSYSADAFLNFTNISDSWRLTVPRPTAGTSSMDITFTLPAAYRLQPATIPTTWSLSCAWGSRTTAAGSQSVTLPADSYSTSPLPLAGSSRFAATGPNTGFNPDTASLRARGDVEPDTYVVQVRMRADAEDIRPLPVDAGAGDCTFEVRAVASGTVAPDTQLLVADDVPAALVRTFLADRAEDAWLDRFGLRPLPDADAVTDRLAGLTDALDAAGCETDPLLLGVGGAYGPEGVTGADALGDIPDATLDRVTRTFSGTLGDGTTYGAPGTSTYNRQGQFYAATDDGGFVAGRFARVRGTRGVVHGLVGRCDGPVSVTEALATWYRGPLP